MQEKTTVTVQASLSSTSLPFLFFPEPREWSNSNPSTVGEPQPGLDILALDTHEWGREVLSLEERCAGFNFQTLHLSLTSGAVDQPLDHSSLRRMVLSNYTARESRNRDFQLDTISEKGDDLKSKKKVVSI